MSDADCKPERLGLPEGLDQLVGSGLPGELSQFEAALAGLRPSAGRLDRDRLFIALGRQAAESELRRGGRTWFWPAAAAALLLWSTGMTVAWATRPPQRIVQRVLYVDRESLERLDISAGAVATSIAAMAIAERSGSDAPGEEAASRSETEGDRDSANRVAGEAAAPARSDRREMSRRTMWPVRSDWQRRRFLLAEAPAVFAPAGNVSLGNVSPGAVSPGAVSRGEGGKSSRDEAAGARRPLRWGDREGWHEWLDGEAIPVDALPIDAVPMNAVPIHAVPLHADS